MDDCILTVEEEFGFGVVIIYYYCCCENVLS